MFLAEGITFDDITLVPQYSDIPSRHDVVLDCGNELGFKMSTPIMSANMETVTGAEMCRAMRKAGGVGVIHRFQSISQLTAELDYYAPNNDVDLIGSVGVDEEDCIKRMAAYHRRGINNICIDVAHGHHFKVLKTIRRLKEAYPTITLIAGNICTADAAKALVEAGADILKVGVGPGSHCTTRVVTGHGVPQITALQNVYNAWRPANQPFMWSDKILYQYTTAASQDTYKCPVPIIADGGIRNSGDIAKALAAGASYVMVGRLFAGCTESPGELTKVDGRLVKVYRGSASYEAQSTRREKSSIIAEGVQSVVAHVGSVVDIVNELTLGIKSACSYTGAATLVEFRERAKYMRVTQSSYLEGTPHGARR